MEPAVAPLRVPGYAIGERLGAGGFGEVFRARREQIDREVAIKVLHAKYSTDAAAVARFIAEARAVNRVQHPGIVEIFDFGALADGRHYCVMELVRGQTLRDLLRDTPKLPLPDALRILRGIADAVDAAHVAGIAHRDLKPDNVFVTSDGGVKLIDFGLAKLMSDETPSVTETGAVFGTPLYMSPEQCRGKAVTLATDLYSFGAIAYQLLTGTPPFSGDALELALHHLNDEPEPATKRAPDLPPHVDGALRAMLAKEPAQRPASAMAAVEMLAGQRKVVRRHRRRWPYVIAASVVTIIGVGSVVVGGDAHHEPRDVWKVRSLRPAIDGTTVNATLDRTGEAIVYADQSGWWKHTLASGTTEALPTTSDSATDRAVQLPDGRFAFGGRGMGTTARAADGSVEVIAKMTLPSLSPDGHQLAGWTEDHWLLVRDLRNGIERRLFRLRDDKSDHAPKWSPDGTLLLWGRAGKRSNREYGAHATFITRVADGVTFPLLPEVSFRRGTNDFYDAVEFLSDGRIVYCSDSDPVEVRARPLFGGPESVVADVAPGSSECIFSARGDRVVVTIGYAQETTYTLDLTRADGNAQLKLLAGPTHLIPTAVSSSTVYAYSDTTHPHGAERVQTPETAPKAHAFPLEGGTGSAVKSCADEGSMVVRDETLLHVTYERRSDGVALQLRSDGDCSLVEEWLFDAAEVGLPTCQGSRCVVVSRDHSDYTVWELLPKSTSTVRMKLPAGERKTPMRAALAPDGTIAFLHGPIHLRASDGAQTTIEVDGGVFSVAFDAKSQLYAAAQYLDKIPFSIVRLGRDGARTVVWSSRATWVRRLDIDPSGKRLIASAMQWHQEFLLLDRTTSP